MSFGAEAEVSGAINRDSNYNRYFAWDKTLLNDWVHGIVDCSLVSILSQATTSFWASQNEFRRTQGWVLKIDYYIVRGLPELLRCPERSGGLGENRTPDTRLFRALLYRLSYQADPTQ